MSGSDLMQHIWDMHCHIVPGVDDGAHTMDTSLEILRDGYKKGIDHIILTPHYRFGMFETPRDTVEQQYKLLAERVAAELPDLKLFLGCEFHVFTDMTDTINGDPRYRLAGTQYVLLEFSEDHPAKFIEERCRSARNAGLLPIIAHGERYDAIRKHIEFVDELHEAGAYLQINANSIIGEDGWSMKHFCGKLLKSERVDFVGSDVHNMKDRRSHLAEACEYISSHYGTEAAQTLFVRNPEHITANEEL